MGPQHFLHNNGDLRGDYYIGYRGLFLVTLKSWMDCPGLRNINVKYLIFRDCMQWNLINGKFTEFSVLFPSLLRHSSDMNVYDITLGVYQVFEILCKANTVLIK